MNLTRKKHSASHLPQFHHRAAWQAVFGAHMGRAQHPPGNENKILKLKNEKNLNPKAINLMHNWARFAAIVGEIIVDDFCFFLEHAFQRLGLGCAAWFI